MRTRIGFVCLLATLTGSACLAPSAFAGKKKADVIGDYEVTVTDLTTGQPFTPPVVAIHNSKTHLWQRNAAASTELKEIAQNGNLGPMMNMLRIKRNAGSIFDYNQFGAPGPLVPAGKPGSAANPATVTGRIRASTKYNRLSWVSMLVCTNDGFTGSDAVALPKKVGQTKTYRSNAYDSKTEQNTEVLADMVPPCQGLVGIKSPTGAPGTTTSNPAIAETGVITTHAGIVGGKDLDPAVVDWTDPVAEIKIERIN